MYKFVGMFSAQWNFT